MRSTVISRVQRRGSLPLTCGVPSSASRSSSGILAVADLPTRGVTIAAPPRPLRRRDLCGAPTGAGDNRRSRLRRLPSSSSKLGYRSGSRSISAARSRWWLTRHFHAAIVELMRQVVSPELPAGGRGAGAAGGQGRCIAAACARYASSTEQELARFGQLTRRCSSMGGFDGADAGHELLAQAARERPELPSGIWRCG